MRYMFNIKVLISTHKNSFKKIKIWGSMRYESLSNLVILPEKEGEGKFNTREYVKEIMDGELFECWVKGMEELGDILIMEDGAGYHCGAATVRRELYQTDGGWQGWGPETRPANEPSEPRLSTARTRLGEQEGARSRSRFGRAE